MRLAASAAPIWVDGSPPRVPCPMQAYPLTLDLRHQLNPEQNKPTLKPGGLSIWD
jgi:hypothetical protein